jgi:hypothetical protein
MAARIALQSPSLFGWRAACCAREAGQTARAHARHHQHSFFLIVVGSALLRHWWSIAPTLLKHYFDPAIAAALTGGSLDS